MKRAPLVIAGTVMGLVGVLHFHTTPASLSLAGLTTSAGSSTSTATTGSPAPTTTPTTTTPSFTHRKRGDDTGATATTGSPTTTRPPTPTTGPPTPTTTVSTGSRTATGPLLDYHFGALSVTVKATGSKITAVTIGSLNDGGNFRSQSIDGMAIPILEQEAMSAQSGNIQSVSGASYTSAGFIQSLQAALTTLGL